jgi:hypothetical protein
MKLLLEFAIEEIGRTTDELEHSHMNHHSKLIEPAEVAEEIRVNRVWIRQAEAAIKSTIEPPGA